jgi:hypothetical protein
MTNVDTVRASMQAYLDQDREAAGRLLADDYLGRAADGGAH